METWIKVSVCAVKVSAVRMSVSSVQYLCDVVVANGTDTYYIHD